MRVRRYRDIPGEPVSFSWLLRAAFPRPELWDHLQTQAAELARAHPDEPAEGIVDRYADWSGFRRGQKVHDAITAELRGEPVETPARGPQRACLDHWRSWYRESHLQALVVGTTVWNSPNRYAVDLDLLAIEGEQEGDEHLPRVAVDWRTTTDLPERPYLDHAVQLAAASVGMIRNGEWKVLGRVDYGMLVYVSPEGVVAHDVAGDEWVRAHDALHAVLSLARLVYPEVWNS